jgi:phage shock protein PspC (stress-responsive transcriptional regulator)
VAVAVGVTNKLQVQPNQIKAAWVVVVEGGLNFGFRLYLLAQQ